MADKMTREKLIEKLRERRIETRRKWRRRAVRVGAGLGVIAILMIILYPYLNVSYKISKARDANSETRKAALLWLAENKVQRARPVFLEALNASYGEREIAEKALRSLEDPSMVPELIEIWNDKDAKPYGRYSALQLLAEYGGKEHEDIFIDPLALLSDGWESSYDWLKKHADEKTVEKLLEMLNSDDERARQAAAKAFRFIKNKPVVADKEKVKDALAAALDAGSEKVRVEAAYSFSEMADDEQFDVLVAALDDENPDVRRYAIIGLGELSPEVAEKAIPELLDKFRQSSYEICSDAANTLIKIGSADAVAGLVEIIRDKKIESYNRGRAIDVLKTLDDPVVHETIIEALADSELVVAKTAAVALIKIGGEESVGPLVDILEGDRPGSLKITAAYVLGILARQEAASALVEAMTEGDYELSAIAGKSLVKTGARDAASKLAGIATDPEMPAVSRRDALQTASRLRAVDSVDALLSAFIDPVYQVREEARDSGIQLSEDLLSNEGVGLEQVKGIVNECASQMLQKEIGEKLREDIEEAKTFGRINTLVFQAMRSLDDKNKPDFDALEVAISEARALYWSTLLRDDFEKRGLSPGQLKTAAESLKEYVRNVYVPEEPPMPAHRDVTEMLRKDFGFTN